MEKDLVSKIGAILFLIIIISWAGFMIYQKEKNNTDSAEGLYEAKYYEQLDNGIIRCNLCPNRCILSSGQLGTCRARKNIAGKLYSLVYGRVASAHVDPIEKKPLYHVLPGSKAYSIATTGCNLQCRFCQNWQISQIFPWEVKTVDMSPEQVVEQALKSGAQSIAYTYTEPTVFYEYMFDIAKLAHEKGLKNVVISAGYINPEPLKALLPYIDAYKIDLKGIDNKFYEKMTLTGQVGPVLEAMKIIKQSGTWLEVVNLVIPGANDGEKDIKDLIIWVRDNLGKDVPLHFSQFHPDYKMLNIPVTTIETLKKARQMALDLGMKYVYTGNVYDIEGSTTFCPESGKPAITRQGYFLQINNLDESGSCSDNEKIPGIWK